MTVTRTRTTSSNTRPVEGSCPLAFCEDLLYWEIEESCLERCCSLTHNSTNNSVCDQMTKACREINKDDLDIIYKQTFFGKLWDVMENPDTNGTAKLVSMVSVSFVVISTCCMSFGTIQSLQVRLEDGTLTDNLVIETLETLSVVWFTLEYLLRLLSCPDKWEFLGDKLNCLDVAAVLPFYVPLGISWVENHLNTGTAPSATRDTSSSSKINNPVKYIDFANNLNF